MRKRLLLLALILAAGAAGYLLWRLLQGPGRFEAGLPADANTAAAERDAFLAGAERYGRGRHGSG